MINKPGYSIEVKNGRASINCVDLYQIDEDCYLLTIDFASKYPELLSYSNEEFIFKANEKTLHVDDEGDEYTRVSFKIPRSFIWSSVFSNNIKYNFTAIIMTADLQHEENIVASWWNCPIYYIKKNGFKSDTFKTLTSGDVSNHVPSVYSNKYVYDPS